MVATGAVIFCRPGSGTIAVSTESASLVSKMQFESPDWETSGPTNYTLLQCTADVPLTTEEFSINDFPSIPGLTEEALLRAGLGEARSERLRHALYVYSCGFGELLLEQPHLLRRRARLALHHLNPLLVLGTLEQLRLEATRLALEHLVEHVHPREALRAARLAQRRRHRCGGDER